MSEATGPAAVVLTVTMAARTRCQLRSVVRRSRLGIVEACSVRQAVRLIGGAHVFAIICESDLRDGTFRDLMGHPEVKTRGPLVIVTSRIADERLWGEVINLGGWDVLAQPFDDDEIRRVVDSAWRHWQQDARPIPPASSNALKAASKATG